MEAVAIVFITAILVETMVEVIKGWVPPSISTPAWLFPVLGAVLGILVCVLANVDAFALAGVDLSIPWVGQAFTGVLVSRGASFVHDLWDKIRGESSSDTTDVGI